MSGQWAGSTRRSELPANWTQIRGAALRRDPACTLAYPGVCTGRSTEVDHIDDKHDHRPANLRGVCHECHAKRTQEQARAAARPNRRPPEPHPGLM